MQQTPNRVIRQIKRAIANPEKVRDRSFTKTEKGNDDYYNISINSILKVYQPSFCLFFPAGLYRS
ncbi:hypothetical protein [Nostoc sp. MG11]|uniref:hypothetical protein n=1 Tax=Nostoc sp. MG11 TaxID=2721166 RepID=UPI001866AF50|nr:hypothetical protein [Nostoc sp. MG11]